TTLALLLPGAGRALLPLALACAWTRLAAGAHSASDVAFGAVLGALAAVTLHRLAHPAPTTPPTPDPADAAPRTGPQRNPLPADPRPVRRPPLPDERRRAVRHPLLLRRHRRRRPQRLPLRQGRRAGRQPRRRAGDHPHRPR